MNAKPTIWSFIPLMGALMGALMGLSMALPAQAQQLSALKDHDVGREIDISAEHAELLDQDNVAIFSGAVRVIQGDLKLLAEQMRVYYEGQGSSGEALAILRIDVEGGVQLTSPSEIVDSTWGVYDVEQEVITLGGTVMMRRGDTQLNGERLVLNLRSGQSVLDGGASDTRERVRGRFTVPKKSDSEATQSPPSDNR